MRLTGDFWADLKVAKNVAKKVPTVDHKRQGDRSGGRGVDDESVPRSSGF